MKKKYQVFISSTYDDLKQERMSVINTLLEMDCIPSGMEAFCAEDEEQFEVIKKVIDLCDYYILIIGKRYGTINPTKGISYTEMEYDYAVQKRIPVLVFPVDEKVDKPSDNNEDKLERFKSKAFGKRMGAVWHNPDDLAKHVAISLTKAFDTQKRPGWTRDNVFDQNELLSQINSLRLDFEKVIKERDKYKKYLDEEKKKNLELMKLIDASETEVQQLIPLEELELKIECNTYTGEKYIKTIPAIEVFKKISIKMLGVSLKASYFNDCIVDILGVNKERLVDKTIIDRISNYFISLGLIVPQWDEKKSNNYYALTKKGVKEKDKLNGFWKEK